MKVLTTTISINSNLALFVRRCTTNFFSLINTLSEESEPSDGRIIFKKPVKRKTESVPENSTDEKEAKVKTKKPKQNLLSFNDDDEEDT